MCCWGHRNLKDNAGLCGDVVSVGTVTTSYDTSGTALGTACPTVSPTATRSPTSNKPCCDVMRQNPLFACMEERWPLMAQGTCQECGGGTGK